MKNKFKIIAGAFTALFVSNLYAEEPVTIYLLTPSEYQELTGDLPPTDIPEPTAAEVKPTAKKKTLDDVIQETKAVPLTEKQKRVIAMVERDQRDFLSGLDQFLKVPFDPNDDKASPEFNAIRDSIVELVMKAHTERSYYERLYLINSLWLAHQEEAFRFSSLDRHLLERWQSMDENRRRLQSMIIAGSAVIGAGAVGYVTFRLTAKSFGVVATDGILTKLGKWTGRMSFVFAGVYIGSMLGRYVGFLGSDRLFGNTRDYLDPVDGTEDLKDLLDEIDPIP